MPPILKVSGLSKQFRMHILGGKIIEALEDVSFQIEQGQIVGLTGKSGSGKSTLMKAIYRTYLACSGNIDYLSASGDIINLRTAPDSVVLELRRKEINYCSQFLRVIPRVAAIDVVADTIVDKEAERPSARIKAAELVQKLGLPKELWDAFPSTFSGGEQQRINIARAIIAKPRFLLVDEPTASLDAKTKDVVIQKLLELKDEGTSILLITHDEHTLNSLSDKIVHLSMGRIAERLEAQVC
jgi:alpha-D-ribose 1-methylphosphonate 5-triphosphate synthase subunit PhnL